MLKRVGGRAPRPLGGSAKRVGKHVEVGQRLCTKSLGRLGGEGQEACRRGSEVVLTKFGFTRKWRHEDLREARQRGSGGMSKRVRRHVEEGQRYRAG